MAKTSTIKKNPLKMRAEKVSNLIEYAENARNHSEKQVTQLAKSIERFGFCTPCLVDKNNVLIAGHGRLLAAKQLGIEEVPVVQIDHLTPRQIKAYRLADNQLALNSDWNIELLGLELGELQQEGFDLNIIGFGDLTGFPFMPSLDPSMKSSDVSEGHLDRAHNQLNNQFESLSADKSESGIEVACPHCGEEFKVVGH